MGRRLLIGVGALFLLCIVLAAIGGRSQPGSESKMGTQPAGTPASTSTPAPTQTPPPPPIGARQNPVPLGTVYRFEKDGRVYEVQVVEVIRNATARVKQANFLNPDPEPGSTYVLIKLRLAYLSGPSDFPFKTDDGDHRLYAANRFWGAPSFSVPPRPWFSGQDIFPGAVVEGWLGPKYLPTELQDEAVLVYNGVYFALR